MTMDIAVLGLEVKSDSVKTASRGLEGLQKSSSQAETATGKLQNRFQSLSTGATALYRQIAVLAGAYGLGHLAKSFVGAASEAEGYRVRLNVLLKSQKEGNRLFQEMSAYAAKVPFEYREVMAAATQLSGVMSGGVDQIKQWMPLIGDLAAVSGLSLEDTTGQVQRMFSSGAASADMFRERGILAMLGFESGVTYTAEETRQRLVQAWASMDSNFRGATDNLSKTWTGVISMYQDQWFAFRNKMMDNGPFEVMKQSASLFLEYLNSETGKQELEKWAMRSASAIISGFEGATYAAQCFSKVISGWKLILAAVEGSIGDVLLGFASAQHSLPGWIAATDAQILSMERTAYLLKADAQGWAIETAAGLEDMSTRFDEARKKLKEWAGAIEEAKEKVLGLAENTDKMLGGTGGETLKKRTEDAKAATDELVENEKAAADQVSESWLQAFEQIDNAIRASWKGTFSDLTTMNERGASSGFDNMLGLAGTIIQVAKPNYEIRSVGSIDGKAYYSQETLSKAMENANADYQRQLAQYEAAVEAAEELRRQWESVLSSYEGLLTSIEDYQPTMSFSALSSNLDQATASVEAAKNFLKDLTYYANQLQGYKSGFESLGDRIEAEITARTRAGWGASEYMALYQSLSAQYAGLDTGAADYYDQALELSEDMLDALLAIEDATDSATAATLSLRTSLVGVFGTLDTGIAGLYGSELAPSQSLEFYTGRYATLYNRASSSLEAEDVSALISFVQQSYLPFLQSYGGDYQGIFDSTIQDLEALQDAMGYSILGTFGTINEALEQTGAWAEWFAKQLDLAGVSAQDSGAFAAWLAERLGEDLTGALGTTGSAASSSTAALANISTELGTLADNTTTSLAGVTTALNSLVTTLEAAIASISSSTGTTVNVSVPSPSTPVTTLYDYEWAFALSDNYVGYYSGGVAYYRGKWTTPHGGSVYDYMSEYGGYTSGKPSYGYAYTAAEGMLFTDDTTTRIGEKYPEAAVPLTERHLEPFLAAAGYGRDNVAADVAEAVKSALGPMMRAGGQGGDPIVVKLVIDGREVGNVVATQMESNSRLVGATKRVARSS